MWLHNVDGDALIIQWLTYKNDPGKKTLHCGQWHYVIASFGERLGVGVGSQLLTVSSSRTKTGDKVKTHCSWQATQAHAWFQQWMYIYRPTNAVGIFLIMKFFTCISIQMLHTTKNDNKPNKYLSTSQRNFCKSFFFKK